MLKTVPLGETPNTLVVHTPRLECKDCNKISMLQLSIAEPRKAYTKKLTQYIIRIYKHLTIYSLAALVCLSWRTIRDIINKHLVVYKDNINLKSAKRILIDEFATHKGYKYVTVVLDADTDKILYVAAGRKEKSLRPFWELLGEEGRKRIKAVGIDMGGPFIKAVKDFLSHASIVFDHFHVSKMINTEINSIRKDLLKCSNEFLNKKLNKA